MPHQSLYRKYRPQRFEDVVGQQHITRTLRFAVEDRSVAHAYLFTGPRGTGKTTTARILAKALDCEKGPTPDFDDTCEDCRAIAEGRHPDVYELDAASRTGVDDVREEIIGRVNYAATRGKYKVYIIDEVHMLSKAAFNALLKTLEEPPSHVVFVLATTDPHKVPDTIQSRCQRFDFHRISVEDIAERLGHIAQQEGIEVANGALTLIARHASGGLRDAIGTLEQLAAFTGKSIALDDVAGLLGEVDSSLLFEIADLIASRDVVGCFRFVAGLAETGVDMTQFVRELTGHFRDLFVVSAAGDATGIVDTTTENLARLTSQAREFGSERLPRILDLLGQLSSDLRWTPDGRLALEVALVRMTRPKSDLTIDALAERIEELEREVGGVQGPGAPALRATSRNSAQEPPAPAPAGATASASTRSTAGSPVVRSAGSSDPLSGQRDVVDVGGAAAASVIEPVVAPEPVAAPVAVPGGRLDSVSVKRAWPAVLAEIKKARTSRYHVFATTDVDVDDDMIVVEFRADEAFQMEIAQEPDVQELLRRSIASVLGVTAPVRYQLGRGKVRPVEKPAEKPVERPVERPRAAGGIDDILADLGAEEIASPQQAPRPVADEDAGESHFTPSFDE